MKAPVVVNTRVDNVDICSSVSSIMDWCEKKLSRYVCVANVHMCMEAHDDAYYRRCVNEADLVVADGMPLFWAQKLYGYKGGGRVRGADLMIELCRAAELKKLKVGLLGSTPHVLTGLRSVLKRSFPGILISYSLSPPFRPMTKAETDDVIFRINEAGIHLLFIGMGCPKQEIWMAENKDRLKCVQVGVGAAFDFISGNKKSAPKWIQKSGFEWLFRLGSEPKRLWGRYAKQNPRFVYFMLKQVFMDILKKLGSNGLNDR